MLGNSYIAFHILLSKLILVQMVEMMKKYKSVFLIKKCNIFVFDLERTGGTLQKHQLPSLPAISILHFSEFEGATYNKASHKGLMRNI